MSGGSAEEKLAFSKEPVIPISPGPVKSGLSGLTFKKNPNSAVTPTLFAPGSMSLPPDPVDRERALSVELRRLDRDRALRATEVPSSERSTDGSGPPAEGALLTASTVLVVLPLFGTFPAAASADGFTKGRDITDPSHSGR